MPTKKITIVIADDNPQLLRLVARNLEFDDYEVFTASDGKQTLDLIEAPIPDAFSRIFSLMERYFSATFSVRQSRDDTIGDSTIILLERVPL